MKILIGCEFSGIVRDAFLAKGHEAWSCDVIDSDKPINHLKDDLLNILDNDWDMLIAFPPCTHLSIAGARWFPEKIKSGVQQKAIQFFLSIANSSIPKIAIENPIGIMSKHFRKPDQIIQPYQFGHTVSKKTCLWLKNLPKLIPTNIVQPEWEIRPNGYKMDKWSYNIRKNWNKETMGKEMSKTFQGIADAMADQWG